MKKRHIIIAVLLAVCIAFIYLIGFRRGRSIGQRDAYRSASAADLHWCMQTIELIESGHSDKALDAERKLAWLSILGAHEFRNARPPDDRRYMNELLARTAGYFATTPLHIATQPGSRTDLVASVESNATLSAEGQVALKQMENVVMDLEEIENARNQLTLDTLNQYLQEE